MKQHNWKRNIFLFFILTRIIIWILGVRLHVNYEFMYFHGVDQLENNFWEALIYTHTLNPAMNILAGFTLLLPEVLQFPFYVIIFLGLSLLLLWSMGKILEVFQFKGNVIFYVLAFFSITPAFLYFETFLIYTMPSTAFLMLVCYQFYKGISENTIKRWLIFFTSCMILSFIRSSYHLVWVVSVLIGILIIDFKFIKNKLIGFAIPTSLIFLWYFKNYLLFGFFGISSWGGFNFQMNTTIFLSDDEKTQLVEEGKMSPLIKISTFSEIGNYSEFVDLNEKTGIAVLDDTHKINGIPNYNHVKYIELSSMKMEDNKKYLKLFPTRYLKTVARNLINYHRPSTRWHPHDKTLSPHIPNRKKIGRWENIYNNIVHFPFTKGIGFYLFLVPIYLFSMIRSSIRFLRGVQLSKEEKLLTFINWNIFFLMFVSCMMVSTELQRYRFITEGLIWISALVFLGQRFAFLKTKKK